MAPADGGRFAPTPTGDLHLGNARTALLSWLSARSHGLKNRLRIDDLDLAAMPDGCLEGQLVDLQWLGLKYDESPTRPGPVGPYRQSQRMHHYRNAMACLNDLGLLYPCWCSRKEVLRAAHAPHANDEGPIYPGTCRPKKTQPLSDLATLPERNGRAPALRIDIQSACSRLNVSSLSFDDAIAGAQIYDLVHDIGDFVVRRMDGLPAYQLACAYDDVSMGCAEVMRGQDLLTSTARQLLILDSLGYRRPNYAHVGLVTDHRGERLSKRAASVSLKQLRQAGVSSKQVLRLLATLSGLPATSDLDHLTDAFDLSTMQATAVGVPSSWIEAPKRWTP